MSECTTVACLGFGRAAAPQLGGSGGQEAPRGPLPPGNRCAIVTASVRCAIVTASVGGAFGHIPTPNNSKTVFGICCISLTASTVASRIRRSRWRPTVHDAASFRARFGLASHPLMIEMCRRVSHFWALDILHVVDYHGVGAHCVANVLCDIIRDDELGSPNQSVSLDRFGFARQSRS